MKHQLKIFLLFTCTFFFMLVSCNPKPSSIEIFGDVIIETADGFRFQDIDWLTELDTIKEEIPEAIYTDELARLEVHEKLDDEQRSTFYYFDDNQFTAGHYTIVLKNESDYESYISDIKGQAQSYFTEHQPMGNPLSDLSENRSVAWEGDDKSYFRIVTFEHQDEYTINFMVSAPQSLPKGLD